MSVDRVWLSCTPSADCISAAPGVTYGGWYTDAETAEIVAPAGGGGSWPNMTPEQAFEIFLAAMGVIVVAWIFRVLAGVVKDT